MTRTRTAKRKRAAARLRYIKTTRRGLKTLAVNKAQIRFHPTLRQVGAVTINGRRTS